MKIITRVDAATAGINKYYTGHKCKKGHLSERYVLSGTCVQCAIESADRHRQEVTNILKAAQSQEAFS
ncbi:hypothetical protein AB6896_09045 [Rahnella inusitata]|uniref:hypothetical protein n=1 Tax=Rahnella inusitata TaxID=58169 RepID=UPI0039BDA655